MTPCMPTQIKLILQVSEDWKLIYLNNFRDWIWQIVQNVFNLRQYLNISCHQKDKPQGPRLRPTPGTPRLRPRPKPKKCGLEARALHRGLHHCYRYEKSSIAECQHGDECRIVSKSRRLALGLWNEKKLTSFVPAMHALMQTNTSSVITVMTLTCEAREVRCRFIRLGECSFDAAM